MAPARLRPFNSRPQLQRLEVNLFAAVNLILRKPLAHRSGQPADEAREALQAVRLAMRSTARLFADVANGDIGTDGSRAEP